MENEKILMPGGTETSFEECFYNLRNTRDFSFYLDLLMTLTDRYLVVLSVKDTPGSCISNNDLDKIHKMGFTKFITDKWWSYIGVTEYGNSVFDEHGAKYEEPLSYEGMVGNVDLYVTSKPCRKGKEAEITINGTNYCLNGRGINIVVFDPEKNEAVDSITYDSYVKKSTFFHRNFNYTEEFFNARFFVPEKYQEVWRDAYRKKYYSIRDLNVLEIENGIFLPNKMIGGKSYGGICDENFNFIAGHATFGGEAASKERHTIGGYKVNDNEIEYIDETVVFAGIVIDHIGHLLIEYFADRLWWYSLNPDSEIKPAISFVRGDGSKFTKELLRLYGFSDDKIFFIERPTKFRKIIVPDQASMMNTWSGKPYDFTDKFILSFNRLKKDLIPSEHKKIYFTKSKTIKSNIIGEDYFKTFYENKGFKIIDPEDYSIAEKIQFLMDADEFVTTLGTNAAYAIFCKPTVKLTLLSRINSVPLDTIAQIVEAANIGDLYCVDVSFNFLHNDFVDGVSLMCVTNDFIRYVREVYNEELDITPEESLKRNLLDYLSFFPEYYSASGYFNKIKNQKMLSILQMMSEVFCGKDFDTSRLDLTTNEDNLRVQVKQLTADLEKSKKYIIELENTDANKTAKLLDATNVKLEKQVSDLKAAIEMLPNLQSKIDELTKENLELAKSVTFSRQALEIQERDFRLTEEHLQNDLNAAKEMNTKLLVRIEEIKSENSEIDLQNTNLKKQINDFERSHSWRITKPMRSTAWFFRKLFGGEKNNNG